MSLPIICLYAKPPVPGRTKSRLAAAIGDAAAAALARAMLLDLVTLLGALPDLELTLWHPPDADPTDFPPLPKGLPLLPQQGRDLGERMRHSLAFCLGERGAPAAMVLGSDCVEHEPHWLRQAVASLATNDMVFQPSRDGGYVLVGARRDVPAAFAGIPWGTGRVMAATRRALSAGGIAFGELPAVADVDTAADLPRLRTFVQTHKRPLVEEWLSHQPMAG